MTRLLRSHCWLAIGVVLVAVIDLVTKVWASRALRNRDVELPGPVDLHLSHNRGVAFGAFERLPASVTIAMTAAVTVLVIVASIRRALPQLPASLIAGGALGNVIDRIEGGSVVDLLHTGWWPTFNLADTFITVGIGLAFIAGFRPPSVQGQTAATPRNVEGSKL